PSIHTSRIEDFTLQCLTLHIGNDLGANFTNIAIQHSEDNGFSFLSALNVVSEPFFLVHVLELPTDEGFINLDWPGLSANLSERAILQSKSQTLQHEPCGLLSNSQILCYFIGRNSVLAVHKQPERREPLVQWNRRILKDRPDLDGELASAFFALPSLLGFQVVMLVSKAFRTDGNAIRPTEIGNGVNTDILIREIADSLLKGLDLRVHVQTLPN